MPDQQPQARNDQKAKQGNPEFRLKIRVLAKHQTQGTTDHRDQRGRDDKPVTRCDRRGDHCIGIVDGN